MATRKPKARETLLNTVARKLGTAAGTVTRVTRELSQDLLVSSRTAEIKAAAVAKKAVKRTPIRGTKLDATAQTSKTKATTSTRQSGAPAVSKRSEHHKSSRTTTRIRRTGAARKTRQK